MIRAGSWCPLGAPQAARSEAQGALRSARDRARACAAEVRKKFDEAKPLQDMLRRLNDGRKDARAQGRNLEATSEAELNDMVWLPAIVVMPALL